MYRIIGEENCVFVLFCQNSHVTCTKPL